MRKKLFTHLSCRVTFLAGICMLFAVTLQAQTPFTITWTGLTGNTSATGVPVGINIIQQYTGVTAACNTSSNGATTSYSAVIQAAPGYNVTITSIGGSAYASNAGSKKFTLQLTNGTVYTQTNFTVISSSSSCGGNTALNAFAVPAAGQTVNSGNQATITVLRGIGGTETGGGYSWTRTLTVSGTVTALPCTTETLSTIVTNATCNGSNNGAINLTATGGTGATGYAWSGPSFSATTQNISGRPAGTYTVTVTSTGGCTTSTTAVINQPAAITRSATFTSPTCNGGTNGSVDLTAGGGTGTLSYLWSNSTTSEDPTNIAAGTYSVTITDANSCTTTASVNVTPTPAINLNAVPTHISCNGNVDGSIDLTVTNAVGTPDYLWSNSAITEDLSGLTAGTYDVTVTDDNGCTNSTSVNINEPGVLTLSTSSTDVSCNGGSNGSIDLTVTGGTGTMDFSWNNSATTEDLTGVVAGAYDVTVTDDNGCSNTTSVTISEPGAINLSAVTTDVLCNGGNNGSIDLTAAGGTGSLDFSWSNSAITEDLSGLAAGAYDVTITDDNSCIKDTSITVSEPVVIDITVTSTDVLCNGGNNGTIDITVAGGVGALDFSWSNSATTEDLSGLTAGTYDVTVTDDDGCTNSASVNISEAALLNLSATTTDVLCNGGNNGSIDLTAAGGTGSLDFSWSNSATTEDLSGLVAGAYDVTITDDNGCTKDTSITVSQPAALGLTAVATDISCNGLTDGSIDLMVTGGTGTLDFNWNNSEVTEDIFNLAAGTYDVTVTDDNGCTHTASAGINEPFVLSVSAVSTGISCNGLTDGSIDITVSGGTGGMDFDWSNSETTEDIMGLATGTYDVTVTDDNGCTNTASAVINEPSAITLTTTATDALCNGGNDGSVDLTATGGTGVLDFGWSNSETTEDITGLTSGTYTVTVTDDNGCTNTSSVIIDEPAEIILNLIPASPLCNGSNNGSIDLTVSGGTGLYSFDWSNSQTTEDVSGLTAGTYDVTVTDDNGCMNIASATIIDPAVAVSSINASTCSVYTSPSGLYTWSAAGVYTDTLTTGNGCDSIITVTLAINTPNVSASVNDHTFTAAITGATYQWVNCSNNFAVVSGATAQTYTSPVNGSFAVIVNQAGCVDTSACLTTFNTSVNENEFNADVKLYPNPNNGIFNLGIDGLNAQDVKIIITDITGKQVYHKVLGPVEGYANPTVEIPSIQPGVYLLTLHADGKMKTIRFIVH